MGGRGGGAMRPVRCYGQNVTAAGRLQISMLYSVTHMLYSVTCMLYSVTRIYIFCTGYLVCCTM